MITLHATARHSAGTALPRRPMRPGWLLGRGGGRGRDSPPVVAGQLKATATLLLLLGVGLVLAEGPYGGFTGRLGRGGKSP